jgi:hypothetical protein
MKGIKIQQETKRKTADGVEGEADKENFRKRRN